MTVDHMLFNNQSWYSVAENADNVKANGKEYMALPVSFTIPKDTNLVNGDNDLTFYIIEDCKVTCVGASGEFYYFCGDLVYDANANVSPSVDRKTWHIDNPQEVYDNATYQYHHPLFIKKDIVKNIIWK